MTEQAKMAIITEQGEIIETVNFAATRPRTIRKAYTMVFQASSEFLACNPAMSSAATWRVLWALLSAMPMRAGQAGEQANFLEITHADLAQMTGLTRETVSRSVAQLVSVGAVERHGRGRILVAPSIASRGQPGKPSLRSV